MDIKKILENVTNESSLSRVYKHTLEHDSGVITAYRSARDCGEGEKFTNTDNKKNNKILKAKLLRLGYGVTAIKGFYKENYGSENEIDVNEESFIVVDLKDKGDLKKELVKLGLEFEQDSIGYSTKGGKNFTLVGSNKCPDGYPGWGKEEKVGKGIFGKDGEFYSRVNGRPFIFAESNGLVETILGFYPTEIRSIKALAEEAIIK